jgi:hypothetical protein
MLALVCFIGECSAVGLLWECEDGLALAPVVAGEDPVVGDVAAAGDEPVTGDVPGDALRLASVAYPLAAGDCAGEAAVVALVFVVVFADRL